MPNPLINAQIEEYLKFCALTRRMSPETIRSKISSYKLFVEETGCPNLENFTNEVLNSFINAETLRGISARTINLRVRHLSALVNYHRSFDVKIPLNLILVQKLREAPPRRLVYSASEIEYVLKKTRDLPEWLLVRFFFDTGLRISEIAHLRLENFSGPHITCIGKGQKKREVCLPMKTYRQFRAYLKEYEITDYIWAPLAAVSPEAYHLRYHLRRIFRRAGFSDFYPHSLRHSFGTDLQRRGATLLEMQLMLGHASSDTTERYIHALDNHLDELFIKYRS